MAYFDPSGFTSEDSDSDDYGFFDKPGHYPKEPQYNPKKRTEVNLQDAIIHGNLKEAEKIVTCDLGNNMNVRLDSGWTALMHACFHAQDKIVKLLLNKGADPNLHGDSVTPLMLTCSNSSASNEAVLNIINALLEKDCILNVGDKYGQTPLMRAIGSGRVAVVQKLLERHVNIEMRDQQGWTATFWAVHHNQPEILELLIAHGARLTEVDKSNRTPYDIATSHDYQKIVDILSKYEIKKDEDDAEDLTQMSIELQSWQDYYPGIERGEKPTYKGEIRHLLYGMNCERLEPLISNSKITLRTFLLLEDNDMIKLGVEMPYQRQRLKIGLRNFHLRGWKLGSVAGLYARKADNYKVLDCLTTLGTHLQQVYILEATIQYTLREYNRIQNQIKFEPPDSPTIEKLKKAAKNIVSNINNNRREIKSMRKILVKISRNNPPPADLIKTKSTQEIALDYVTEVVMICSLVFFAYKARNYLISFTK